MHNRLFTALVIVLWMCTMGWLVAKKVLPTLLTGSPPNYESTLPPEEKRNEPESWRVYWNGSPIGWSESRAETDDLGATTITSKLMVQDLSLGEVLPTGVASLFRSLTKNLGGIDFDVTSHVILDALGGLSSFQTSARVAGLPQRLKVIGDVQDGQLHVSMHSGEFSQQKVWPLPDGALVSNELSPYAYLRNLRVGQSWSLPVYSPFNAPTAPLEMVQATVDRETTIEWNDQPQDTFLVVMRNQAAIAATTNDDVIGQMWVRRDGMVLRQELELIGKRLTFERMTEDEAAELDLWNKLPEVAESAAITP